MVTIPTRQLFSISSRWRDAGSCWSTTYRNRSPIYAAMDFLQHNPDWTRCTVRDPEWADPNKAFDRERTSVPETDFEILRVPRGYSIGSRPVTFGEMPSATEVKGLRIHAKSGG